MRIAICFLVLSIGVPALAGPFEHFDEAAPRIGEAAPEVALRTVAGEMVRIADVAKRGPVVLVFGSFS